MNKTHETIKRFVQLSYRLVEQNYKGERTMSMPRGKKIDGGYATVVEEDGENYRTIAEMMTAQGHQMNHASARNWVLRTMRKFAARFAEAKGDFLTEEEIDAIARSPHFQSAVSDLIQRIS